VRHTTAACVAHTYTQTQVQNTHTHSPTCCKYRRTHTQTNTPTHACAHLPQLHGKATQVKHWQLLQPPHTKPRQDDEWRGNRGCACAWKQCTPVGCSRCHVMPVRVRPQQHKSHCMCICMLANSLQLPHRCAYCVLGIQSALCAFGHTGPAASARSNCQGLVKRGTAKGTEPITVEQVSPPKAMSCAGPTVLPPYYRQAASTKKTWQEFGAHVGGVHSVRHTHTRKLCGKQEARTANHTSVTQPLLPKLTDMC
jgi:hypothetical protein